MAIWRIGRPFDAKPCPTGCTAAVLYNDTGTDHFWMSCAICQRETKTGNAYQAVQSWNHDSLDEDRLTDDQLLLLRLAKFIPPDGWLAKWFLPSEARVAYAQRVALWEEDRVRIEQSKF